MNSIIGEVDELITKIVELKPSRGSSNIALLEPIAFNPLIEARYHHVATDIELSLFVEEEIEYVPLHNEGFSVGMVLVNEVVDLFPGTKNSNSPTSIGVLTWFD